MTPLRRFAAHADLQSKKEIKKALALAFFSAKAFKAETFSHQDILRWFDEAHFHRPNLYRLVKGLAASRLIVQDKSSGIMRLHARALTELSATYDQYVQLEPSEDILSSDAILSMSLIKNTRGYVESLAAQINAAYDANILDGCAVLMRRLLEICLIHAFEHCVGGTSIKRADGGYIDLSEIINQAKANSVLSLSKGTKDCIDEFRVVGNFSAHKIYYNARRADIKRLIIEYRAAVEELLYKAGLKK